MNMKVNESQMEAAHQEIVRVARAILANKIHPIEGCRIISEARHLVGRADDPLFAAIVGFESDTDAFPVGSARDKYNAEYLERLDAEMAEHTEASKASIHRACLEILDRLG